MFAAHVFRNCLIKHPRLVLNFWKIKKMDGNYRLIIERVFNNWQSLRLAVEHGMGGSKSHQTAIDVMNYVCEYCMHNENITQSELEEVIMDLMDQEFNAICEDNSIPEICHNLLRYKQMCLSGRYAECILELDKLPSREVWLKPNFKIARKTLNKGESSTDTDSDTDDPYVENHNDDMNMEIDNVEANSSIESEQGWTTVHGRRKK